MAKPYVPDKSAQGMMQPRYSLLQHGTLYYTGWVSNFTMNIRVTLRLYIACSVNCRAPDDQTLILKKQTHSCHCPSYLLGELLVILTN